jgi:hypothetical protein
VTTAGEIKVTRARFDDGEVIDGEYDVWLDGKEIGTVRRHDHVSRGYWGRWSVGTKYYTDTRADAIAYVVARATRAANH